MCGRMSLVLPQPDVESRFDATSTRPVGGRYNVGPGDDLAVIPNTDPDRIDEFRWGLRPGWVEDPAEWSHPINARAETVVSKPTFREPFERRRCLVLADGFYEWAGQRGSRRPYRIERVDGEPFAFAGLWESWRSNGDECRTAAIVTTEANAVVEPIHDRMPVVLDGADEDRWLEEGDGDELEAMLDPYPDDALRAYEISTRINDPTNDSPDVLDPLEHDQSGLGEFP